MCPPTKVIVLHVLGTRPFYLCVVSVVYLGREAPNDAFSPLSLSLSFPTTTFHLPPPLPPPPEQWSGMFGSSQEKGMKRIEEVKVAGRGTPLSPAGGGREEAEQKRERGGSKHCCVALRCAVCSNNCRKPSGENALGRRRKGGKVPFSK